MSGQQTSRIFSSGFMSGQFDQENSSDMKVDNMDVHGYDVVGNAQLNSVLQVCKCKCTWNTFTDIPCASVGDQF